MDHRHKVTLGAYSVTLLSFPLQLLQTCLLSDFRIAFIIVLVTILHQPSEYLNVVYL